MGEGEPCDGGDKRLNVPGEDTLAGVCSAREFVGWYNGDPVGLVAEACSRG